MKNELESCSLEVIHPAAYQTIKEQLEIIQIEQEPFYETVIQENIDLLTQAKLEVHISLEPQNIYTVYQDLTAKGAAYDHIDNTLRLEILPNELVDCYTAMGHLHQVWKPVPGRFDDYIAVPRDNLYRSLHTTVIHPNGSHIKLRLRTKVMDRVSEVGILARWLYADRPMWSQEIDKPIQVFLENIHENIHIEPQDLGAGVAGVVEDVFRQQIRVYTPRGQMIDLAEGATVVDFAYTIHTGLGNQCHSAQVNGDFYPLNKPLQDGDQVHITKKPWAQPRRAWLDEDLGYLATNYARTHVRRWFRRLSDDLAIAQGKKLLQTELESLNLPTYPHQKIAASFNYHTTQQLYYCLGRAEILPTVVATWVLEDSWGQEPTRHLDNVVYGAKGEKFVIMNADGRLLRLCGTCNPRPGDAITGFLRQDNGVTVHQDSCHLVRPEHMTGRLLRLGWGDAQRRAHIITLQVDVHDRTGLLYEITDLVGDERINISYIHTPQHNVSGRTRIVMSLEIVHPRQLIRILHQIQALANVIHSQVLPKPPLPSKDEYSPSTMYRPE
jgi:GTP pyrophosphokinase